jgi:hypothetical protein
VGNTTRHFEEHFCELFNSRFQDSGMKQSQYCIVNFLYPYHKGSLLKHADETGKFYNYTLRDIKIPCHQQDLPKEKSCIGYPVSGPSPVLLKILSYFCKMITYLCPCLRIWYLHVTIYHLIPSYILSRSSYIF